jgi:hypothetical protein
MRCFFSFVFSAVCILFANRSDIKETMNNTKHLKKNKNYNEILDEHCIFNLQTVSTWHCYYRTSQDRRDVVGCRWKVAEQVKKITSIPETKKRDEMWMLCASIMSQAPGIMLLQSLGVFGIILILIYPIYWNKIFEIVTLNFAYHINLNEVNALLFRTFWT